MSNPAFDALTKATTDMLDFLLREGTKAVGTPEALVYLKVSSKWAELLETAVQEAKTGRAS